MFTNSSITSRIGDALVSYSYPDTSYLFGSKLAPEGLDHSEHYFMCRENYEDVQKGIIELHEQYVEREDSFKQKLVSCIEDPILMSSVHKYVVFLRPEFGHFILNTVLNIALIHEKEPDAVFVIFMDWPHQEDPELKKCIRFLESFFGNHHIKYYFVRSSYFLETLNVLEINTRSLISEDFESVHHYKAPIAHYLVYKSVNVDVVNSGDTTRNLTIKDIKFFIDKYILNFSDPVENPNRKVYITRRHYEKESNAFSGNGYKSNSIRIYDEKVLENYLIANGFEVVDFKDIGEIQDQINLMLGTSVLVGATGTGLTNQLFMKDSQVVVELRIEHGSESTHHWIPIEYFYLSSGKNHTYIAIDVKDKQARTAADKLDKILSLYDLNTLAVESTKN